MKVTPEDVRKLNLPPECVNRTPSGETFVKSSLQKVIPIGVDNLYSFWIYYCNILEDWIA